MAAGKELTLKLSIKAHAREADMVLQRLQGHLKTFGGAAGWTLGKAGGLARLAFAPLAMGGKLLGGAAIGAAALGTAALKAAAGDEALERRMQDVYGSTKRGSEAFAELERWSRRSEFQAENLADALMSLKQYGMDSSRNMRVLGATSRATGQDLGTLAQGVMALQARGLKAFGIEMDQDSAGRYVIQWRDAMDRVQKITARGAAEARKALVDVMQSKFGDDIAPRGLEGAIKMFRNNVGDALGDLGQAALPFATKLVTSLSEKLTAAIESGRLQEWGKKAAEWIQNAFVYGRSMFEYARGVLAALKEKPEAWGDALRDALLGGAQILAVALANYLKAMGMVFVGLGKILAGAFLDDILRLPGMKGVRNEMAYRAMMETPSEQLTPIFGKYNFNPSNVISGDMTADQAMALANLRRQDIMKSGIEDFTTRIPSIAAETLGAVKGIVGSTMSGIADRAGYTGPTFDEILKANQQRMVTDAEPRMVDVTAARWTGTGAQYSTVKAREGDYRLGQVSKDGFGVVQIDKLVLKGDNLAALGRELKRVYRQKQMAFAGT